MRHLRRVARQTRTSHPSEAVLAEYYCLQLLELDSESRDRTARLAKGPGRVPTFAALHARAKELEGDNEPRTAAETVDFVAQLVSGLEPMPADEAWLQAIGERRAVVETQLEAGLRGCFFRNCRRLAASLGFSAKEERIFVLVALSTHHPQLASLLGNAIARDHLSEVFGNLFELTEEAIADLRDERSALFTSGVMRKPDRISLDFVPPSLAPGLASALLRSHGSLRSMLESILHKAPVPELSLEDFEYLGERVKVLRGLVEGAMETHAKGVNILLHGAPGTGKTQLARALAASLGAELVEISVSSELGEKVRSPERRLSSLRFVQRVVSTLGRYVVLFDEAEDLFPVTTAERERYASHSNRPQKGFMNEALESTPTVTLWTSNFKGQVDPAHLRRMHLVLELDLPPQSVRARMVEQRLGDLGLPQDHLDALSRRAVTPAEIERLGRVVELARGVEPQTAYEVALAASVSPVTEETSTEGPEYNPRYCQTNHDLEAIARGLRGRGRGRLLLHGVPGTGKTAWVRFLAKRLDRPLIQVTASTLISKWVGETEANIAARFRDAANQRAVLFFDEADTFLTGRQYALRQYEVALVNEMLCQMERFAGVFACATNRLDGLDVASLRRFDVKVRFGPLETSVRHELFEELLRKLDLGNASEAQRQRLLGLDGLVLGDFASVARGAWFASEDKDAEWLVSALANELRARGEEGERIGFES